MKVRLIYSFILFQVLILPCFGQAIRNINLDFEPVEILAWPGLHSFSYGTYKGKIVCVGGRKDGIHARQPFNAFPETYNNSTIYIINVENQEVDSISLQDYSESVKSHLQANNHEFYQDGKYLIIIGGYAFRKKEKKHITFPYITVLDLEKIIDGRRNKYTISNAIHQIKDKRFAITGGQMGKIDDEYILVGGHKFDGQYNPINAPTFTQEYTDGLLRFKLDVHGKKIKVTKFHKVNDALHLHRRDFNLVSTKFSDGEQGYSLYSGVFQINKELPFLYPVEIRKKRHLPSFNFNQYLSNYHSTKFSARINGKMLTFFLGGISQYYIDGKSIISDELVPFVNTISVIDQDSHFEYKLSDVMPSLIGAAGELVLSANLNGNLNSTLELENWDGNKKEVGYLIGGIASDIDHPFQMNSSQVQSKSSKVIYKVTISQKDSSYLTPVVMRKICTAANFLKLDELIGIVKISVEIESKADLYFMNQYGKIIHSMKDVVLNQGVNNISISMQKKLETIHQAMLIINGNEFMDISPSLKN